MVEEKQGDRAVGEGGEFEGVFLGDVDRAFVDVVIESRFIAIRGVQAQNSQIERFFEDEEGGVAEEGKDGSLGTEVWGKESKGVAVPFPKTERVKG